MDLLDLLDFEFPPFVQGLDGVLLVLAELLLQLLHLQLQLIDLHSIVVTLAW